MDLEKSYTLQRVEHFKQAPPWTTHTSSMSEIVDDFLGSITMPKFFPFSFVAKCQHCNIECYLWFVARNIQHAHEIKQHIENKQNIKILKVYKDLDETQTKEGGETDQIEEKTNVLDLKHIEYSIKEFLQLTQEELCKVTLEQSTSTAFLPITIRKTELFYMCNGYSLKITSKETDLTQIKEQIERLIE